MWNSTCQPYYNTPSPAKNEYAEADLHAHSPRRHAAPTSKPASVMSMESVHMLGPGSILSGPGATIPFPQMAGFGHEQVDPVWSRPSVETDPFMGSGLQPLFHRNTVSEDQSMPDYSRSLTSASGHHSVFPMPENTYANPIYTESQHNVGIEALVQTIRSGTNQQLQDPVPQHQTHQNTPVNQAKSLDAVEMSSGSPHGLASSMHSVSHESANQIIRTPTHKAHLTGTATPTNQIKPSPRHGSGIKSRKEGNASDADLPIRGKRHVSKTFTGPVDHENSGGAPTANTSAVISSEGKRKRANISLTLNDHDVAMASPTRKVSRRTDSKNASDISMEMVGEGGRARTPLVECENL